MRRHCIIWPQSHTQCLHWVRGLLIEVTGNLSRCCFLLFLLWLRSQAIQKLLRDDLLSGRTRSLVGAWGHVSLQPIRTGFRYGSRNKFLRHSGKILSLSSFLLSWLVSQGIQRRSPFACQEAMVRNAY